MDDQDNELHDQSESNSSQNRPVTFRAEPSVYSIEDDGAAATQSDSDEDVGQSGGGERRHVSVTFADESDDNRPRSLSVRFRTESLDLESQEGLRNRRGSEGEEEDVCEEETISQIYTGPGMGLADDIDEITPMHGGSTFRTTGSHDWSDLMYRSARIDPVAKRRVRDEADLLTVEVNAQNVLEIGQMQIKVRRVRQYEELRKALCSASDSLDSRSMLEHLRNRVLVEEKVRNDRELQEILNELPGIAGELFESVRENDRKAIQHMQGTLDALMLECDRNYLEEMQKKKFRYKKAVVQNKPPQPPPKWRQDPGYRLLSVVRGDFTGDRRLVTITVQRWYMSRCAWFFAVFFLLVAIVFVVEDFYMSMTSKAISTEMVQHDSLPLPVVYACLTISQIPMFSHLRRRASSLNKGNVTDQGNGDRDENENNGEEEEDFRGSPLWGLRSYEVKETGERFIFPETHDLVAEETHVGPSGDRCNRTLLYMDQQNIEQGENILSEVPRCYTCLRIGHRKQVKLEYSKALRRTPGALTLEFSIAYTLDYCFHRGGMWNTNTALRIQNELLENQDRLRKVGAVELIDVNDMAFVLRHGLEAVEKLGNEELFVRTRASILCNLYFFSGTMYPVSENSRVRYSFNLSAGTDAWVRLEDDSKYLKIWSSIPMGALQRQDVNRTLYLKELLDATESLQYRTSTTITVRIFTLENVTLGQPTMNDFSAILRSYQNDLLLYSKTVENNVPSYHSSLQFGGVKHYLVSSPYRRTSISLDFETFNVEHNVKVPTTTVVEFLTDLFEYIGLFTGVCAYSVLVSPAKIYLRKKKKVSRQHHLAHVNARHASNLVPPPASQ